MLTDGHAPEEICVLAPWWILLASTTRKLVALLPEQQFDGPGLVPFSNDPDNFWFKLSKILLTESSPQMLVRRMRWARDVIADLQDFGVNTTRIATKMRTGSSAAHDNVSFWPQPVVDDGQLST